MLRQKVRGMLKTAASNPVGAEKSAMYVRRLKVIVS